MFEIDEIYLRNIAVYDIYHNSVEERYTSSTHSEQ